MTIFSRHNKAQAAPPPGCADNTHGGDPIASGRRELDCIRRSFDRQAPGYDRRMRANERRFDPWRRRLVHDLTGRVLEVGIGTGAGLHHYSAEIDLVGIDLSPAMLEHAKRRARLLGMVADLRVMDAQKLDFADGSFDAVVFSLSLCTIPDPAAALREAVRVARPGSPIRYLEHVRSNVVPMALLEDIANPFTVHFQHDHVNRRIVEIAEQAGVEGLHEERTYLGIFSLGMGQRPHSGQRWVANHTSKASLTHRPPRRRAGAR